MEQFWERRLSLDQGDLNGTLKGCSFGLDPGIGIIEKNMSQTLKGCGEPRAMVVIDN